MKTWRTRWTNIVRLKKVSSAHFDEDTGTISLDQKNYMDRIKQNPSEAKFFNKPLENYHYMAVIFGNQQATGIFAKGSSQSLAAETLAGAPDTDSIASDDLAGTSIFRGNGSRNGSPEHGVESSGKKRRRASASEEDTMISAATSALNNIANAIMMTAPRAPPMVPDNLWDILKDISAFDEGDLAHYYGYLVENPSIANAFVKLSLDNKLVWISRYIKNHLP